MYRKTLFPWGICICLMGCWVAIAWGCGEMRTTAHESQQSSVITTITPEATGMPVARFTAVATSTPYPSFPPGARLGGVTVGGMSVRQAEEQLRSQLSSLSEPITLSVPLVPTASLVLSPTAIGLKFAPGGLILEAWSVKPPYNNPIVPIRYNKSAIRKQLAAFASEVTIAPVVDVLREGDAITRTFVYTPALFLDVEQAMNQIDRHLSRPDFPRTISLTLTPDPTISPPPVEFARIRQEAEAMASEWDGIVGLYLVDLEHGDTININEQTVFSGASVMKVPILLNVYARLEKFSEQEQEALRKMIIESDNLAANDMLAATQGGGGRMWLWMGHWR